MLTARRKRLEEFLFILLLLLVYFILNYHEILFLRPTSIHQWAQCDRAAVARCYFQDSMNFFKPRTYYLSNTKDGIVGLEFPFLNYIAAICYKVFGFNEAWYRGLSLCCITVGLYFTFCLTRLLLKQSLLAALVTLAWYLSPILCFYTPNFLSDASSLGLIMTAWFFYFSYREQQKKKFLLLFFVFAAFASLIKITSLISVIMILIITLMELFANRVKLFEQLLKQTTIKRKGIVTSVLIIFSLVIAWYSYAATLTAKIFDKIFLIGLNPPRSWDIFPFVWNDIKRLWLPYYYHWSMYMVFALALLILIVQFKKMNALLRLITLGIFAGSTCFILLEFTQYREHDYYIIALLPFFFFLLITVVQYFQTIASNQKRLQYLLCLFFLTLCGVSTWWCKLYLEEKYADYTFQFNNIENYMEGFGVKPNDRVLVIYDNSFNIDLYFMNRKGWRVQTGKLDKAGLDRFIHGGAQFIIVNDITALNDPILVPYLKKETGEFLGIHIFSVP